jgi:hypothetical protein
MSYQFTSLERKHSLPDISVRDGKMYWADTDTLVNWEELKALGYVIEIPDCPTCGQPLPQKEE